MKKRLTLSGLLLLAALVAAGAFLAQSAQAGERQRQEPVTNDWEEEDDRGGKVIYVEIAESIDGADYSGGVMVTFEDPAELPAEKPAATGLFLARDGNLFTLGSGSIAIESAVEIVNGEEIANMVEASHDGPELQVVIGPDAVIYRDATQMPDFGPEEIEAGQVTVTNVLEAGSIDDIGDNTMVRVWGTQDGDQVLAEIVVYEALK